MRIICPCGSTVSTELSVDPRDKLKYLAPKWVAAGLCPKCVAMAEKEFEAQKKENKTTLKELVKSNYEKSVKEAKAALEAVAAKSGIGKN